MRPLIPEIREFRSTSSMIELYRAVLYCQLCRVQAEAAALGN